MAHLDKCSKGHSLEWDLDYSRFPENKELFIWHGGNREHGRYFPMWERYRFYENQPVEFLGPESSCRIREWLEEVHRLEEPQKDHADLPPRD